jgi:hypothetical protein
MLFNEQYSTTSHSLQHVVQSTSTAMVGKTFNFKTAQIVG